MALNSRQRSASSGSRANSRTSSSRGGATKGRPSSSRSVRINQPTSSRRGSANPSARRSNTPHLSGGRKAARVSGQGTRGSMRNGSSLRSVGVGELGSMPAMRRAGNPWIVRIFITLVVLIVLGAVGFAVAYNANIMPVSKLTVSGTKHLTNEELTNLAQVPAKTTLFNVDTAGIEERLKSNPWVLNATVERIPPDTLNLKIEERSITAVVDVTVDENATVETWALSEDGIWLTQVPTKKQVKENSFLQQLYDDSNAALKISDVPLGSKPEAGAVCADSNIKNALGIVAGMTTELADQVKYVSAASAESTTLVLDNGVEIAFGDDTSIRDKERVCLELLKEHEGKISYINVRTVSNPIWRSLSQGDSSDLSSSSSSSSSDSSES